MIRSSAMRARHIRMRAGRAVVVTAATSLLFFGAVAAEGYAQDKNGLAARSSPLNPSGKAPEAAFVAHIAAITPPERRPPLPERRNASTPASAKAEEL